MVKKIKIGIAVLLLALVVFLVVTYERPAPPIDAGLSTEVEIDDEVSTSSENETESSGSLGDINIGDINMPEKDNQISGSNQENFDVEKISWTNGYITVEKRMAVTDRACELYEEKLRKETGDDITVEWRNPRGEEYNKFEYPVSWYLARDTSMMVNMHLTITNKTKDTTEEVFKTLRVYHDINGLVIEE